MKNYLYKSLFAFVVSSALFSCNSKSKTENVQQTTGETDKDTAIVLTAYNSKNEQNVQAFEINTSKPQTIKGNEVQLLSFLQIALARSMGK